MEGLIVFAFIAFSLLLAFSIQFGVRSFYRNKYNEAKHKFSDAAIFRLMVRANHFLTPKQLAAVSTLTAKEAWYRLNHLAMEGILRKYQSGGNEVFQLKEDIPFSDKLPTSIKGLSEKQIIEVILEYAEDYQVTIAELVVIFGIDIYKAKELIKRLRKANLIMYLRRGTSKIYVISHPLNQQQPKLKIPAMKQAVHLSPQVEKIKIPDADIINLAVEQKGRLTPATVCYKLKIPLRAAKTKLEDMYEQGAFIMDVDEKNAVVEYHLRDKSLLKK